MSRLVPLSLALLLSLGLAGCGKRGALEPPPGTGPAQEAAQTDAKARNAKVDPKARTFAAANEAAAQEEARVSGETATTNRLGTKKRAPIVPPKRDLIIDRILD